MFNWTRNPVEARRLAQRREAILSDLLGARKPMVPPGVTQLMDILQVGSAVTRGRLHPGQSAAGGGPRLGIPRVCW